MGDSLEFSVESGVAVLRFNRPKALNALDLATARALLDAAERIAADPDIRVVVLSGEGRAFMAGGDLGFMHAAEDRQAALVSIVEPTHAALKLLADSPAITIASVQGAAAGAGMSIALGTDLCIAADNLSLSFAYPQVAGPGDCGGTWALECLLGLRRAMEVALMCETIDATRALDLGLVNKVVPAVELDAETARLARRIAAGPSRAFGHIKSLLRGASSRHYAAQLDVEAAAFADCAGGPDFGEALSAFLEKRAPKFTGR